MLKTGRWVLQKVSKQALFLYIGLKAMKRSEIWTVLLICKQIMLLFNQNWKQLIEYWPNFSEQFADITVDLISLYILRGYYTPGPYFWRICVFSLKNKATLNIVSNGSD